MEKPNGPDNAHSNQRLRPHERVGAGVMADRMKNVGRRGCSSMIQQSHRDLPKLRLIAVAIFELLFGTFERQVLTLHKDTGFTLGFCVPTIRRREKTTTSLESESGVQVVCLYPHRNVTAT